MGGRTSALRGCKGCFAEPIFQWKVSSISSHWRRQISYGVVVDAVESKCSRITRIKLRMAARNRIPPVINAIRAYTSAVASKHSMARKPRYLRISFPVIEAGTN